MFRLKDIINDRYQHNCNDTTIDVVAGLSTHWRSMHKDDPNVSMFTINPQTAKWLLYTLKHEPVTPKQSEAVRRLERVISTDGIKGCMPKKSILINPLTNTLLNGVTRLYSVAMAEKGTYLAIEFVTDTVLDNDN